MDIDKATSIEEIVELVTEKNKKVGFWEYDTKELEEYLNDKLSKGFTLKDCKKDVKHRFDFEETVIDSTSQNKEANKQKVKNNRKGARL